MEAKERFAKYNQEHNRLYKEMDDLYHSVAVRCGMSDSAFDILYSICVLGEGCTQKEICQVSFVKKQTINSAIQKLEREGVLRLAHGNGREVKIFLTREGKRLLDERVAPVLRQEEAVFAEMSEKDSRELLRLVSGYVSCLRQKLGEIESTDI